MLYGLCRYGFLSRLCGGEVVVKGAFADDIFLSRLCGGEANAQYCPAVATFLSRLCGGEDGNKHGTC